MTEEEEKTELKMNEGERRFGFNYYYYLIVCFIYLVKWHPSVQYVRTMSFNERHVNQLRQTLNG